MAIMNGLGTYATSQAGIGLFVIILIFLSSIGFLYYSLSKNYQKVKGFIKTDNESKIQILKYVADQEYTKIIYFSTTTTKNKNENVTTSSPQYPNGECTIYYAKNNPTDIGININPVLMSQICSCVLCILSISSGVWFYFLRKNKNLAGVVGGLSVANVLTSSITK